MSAKKRLSVTVDEELLRAAEQATRRGEANTLSAYVNAALRLKLEQDRRLRALETLLAEFEADHGPITDRDREEALREAKRRAISVRGLRAGESPRKYRR